jgi:hypothetical protein
LVIHMKMISICFYSCVITCFCARWNGQSNHILVIKCVATPLWGSVRMTLTLLKWGLGSPLGLPKTQSSIARVKTPCIEVFFIPLERSWSVDVKNSLAWAIQTSTSQVMYERKAKSQTGDLTFDH